MLRTFYNYALKQDISILLNRQRAYQLFVLAQDDDGHLSLDDNIVDKIMTFLRMDENQYNTTNTVSLYAFQKHLGEIRKLLRSTGGTVRSGSMSSNPSTPERRSHQSEPGSGAAFGLPPNT